MSSAPGATSRPLPELTELTAPFWRSGADGVLRVQRCQGCDRLVHPPALVCPYEHHRDLRWTELTGRATLESWTVNAHAWFPGFPSPYVVALVAPLEDPRTRILTNLVGFEPAELRAGMEVEVRFEHVVPDDPEEEPVHLPLFGPVGGDGS